MSDKQQTLNIIIMEEEEKERFRNETARQILISLVGNCQSYTQRRGFAKESIEIANNFVEILEETPPPTVIDNKHPFIERKGFVRITSYKGRSKYIIKGKIYEGYAEEGYNSEMVAKVKIKSKPSEFFTLWENGATWEEATLEEYLEQQKKLQQ